MGDNKFAEIASNNTESIIYISDIETFNLLYMNEAGKKAYKIYDDKYKGMKCYKFLQNKKEPCEFCTNNRLRDEKIIKWTNFNYVLNGYYAIYDRLIELEPGHYARLEIANNLTDSEEERLRIGIKAKIDKVLLKCIRALNEHQNMKSAIDNLLLIITNFYDANRAYIFEIDEDNGVINNTYEWCAEGVSKEIDNLQNVPIKAVTNWLKQFEKKGSFSISSLEHEVDKNSIEYDILHDQGIQSLITAPLMDGNRITGIIGVDDPRRNIDVIELLVSITYFIMNDIHKRKMLTQLEYLSYIDVLSGLYNRNKYMIDLYDIEKKGSVKIGVVYIDLNGLKIANNQYGHEYGDKLIQKVAINIKNIFGENSYRIGGDEFVVLCCDIKEDKFKDKVCKLRENIKNDDELSASIGDVWNKKNLRINDLIKHADELMYANKQYFYQYSGYQGYNHNSSMAKEIIDDILNNHYIVYLQPKVDLKTGSTTRAEALIRRFNKDGVLVYPDSFIPFFEAEGVIRHIDLYVLEEVCYFLADLKSKGKESHKISVNFSRITLMELDIVKKMVSICEKYSVSTAYICVEITESISKLDMEALIKLAKEIKQAGFYLSLDDYGAKYSNTAILFNIDFDEIKFDRSIISKLMTNDKTAAFIQSLIFMVKEFNEGTDIVAEGIETYEEIEMLKKFGCDYGQGYYFSKPISMKEFISKYVK